MGVYTADVRWAEQYGDMVARDDNGCEREKVSVVFF